MIKEYDLNLFIELWVRILSFCLSYNIWKSNKNMWFYWIMLYMEFKGEFPIIAIYNNDHHTDITGLTYIVPLWYEK